jgi:hypothetical protein
MFAIKLIYGIVVWSGCLLVVAYSQVELTEKYFPALNAAMHNNGSEDEPYVDYVFVRIRADMSALESASNNSTWAGTRSDLLHNESSLVDLETQNAKLQDTLARERFSNVGANVVCERWAINEFGPALKNYTASKRAFFLAAKANPTITPENDLAVQAILGQERESSRHLQQILSDSGASCPK